MQYLIEVLENHSFQDLINLGKYAHIKSGIPQMRVRSQENNGTWECSVIAPMPGEWISTSKALELCQKDGWIPAELEHILQFGGEYPDYQTKHPLVALGIYTMWEVPCYPTLGIYEGGRKLGLRSEGFDWYGYHFLRVKKKA